MPAQSRVAYFFLFTALLSSLVAFPLGGYSIGPRYCAYLFSLYIAFTVISCLLEIGSLPTSGLCSWGGPCE